MKKTIFNLSALILAFVMALTVLAGCNKPSDNSGNGGNTGTGGNGTSQGTETVEITTTIYEIAKHGNLILYMYGSDIFDKGFEHGDILEIAIGDKKWDVPLCTSYSDVDNGEVVLRAISPTDGVVLAINMGDFATTAGIATKSAIDEDPGYRWDYVMESPVEITITMKEKDGYRDEWLIRQLVRTNERSDYEHLSDEEFANFRVIATTGMGRGLLYRSSSPINPAFGRSTYADKAAENAGILTVVNLADTSNTYEGAENTYYSTCQTVFVNLSMDLLAESTLSEIAEAMRFIIDNEGPYLIHCNEGKDRAGFVSAVLECLMGATMDEVIDDFMLTYYNYYGVVEGSENYDAVLNNNLIKLLNTTFKVEDIYKADLVKEAEAFLMEDAGLTLDEVAALKARLRISLQEVYDAGKNLTALLGDHDSVSVQAVVDGTVISEMYLDKECSYTFYSPEYMNLGFSYQSLTTDHSQYICFDGEYSFVVPIAMSGVVDFADSLAMEGENGFISSVMLNDTAVVTERDGLIIVSCTADIDEIYTDDAVVSCVETYTLDAKTREIISVKTVYTYADGTIEEGTAIVTRDGEMPEGAQAFLAYEGEDVEMRTVTIVSHPGTEDERTDVVRAPKGLLISLSPEWDDERIATMYEDAACTQPISVTPDPNLDATVYVRWELME